MQQAPSPEHRLIAALSYPIWIVAVVALLTNMKEDRFVRVHAIQALGLSVSWLIVYVALALVRLYALAPLFSLLFFVLALYYAYQTYQGQVFRIPIVSDVTSRYTG